MSSRSQLRRPSEAALREVHRRLSGLVAQYLKRDNPNARVGPFEMPYDYATDFVCPIEGVTTMRIAAGMSKELLKMGAEIVDEKNPVTQLMRREFVVPIARLRQVVPFKGAHTNQQQQQRRYSFTRAGVLLMVATFIGIILVLVAQ